MNQTTNKNVQPELHTCNGGNCEGCGKCTATEVPPLHTLFLGVTEDCNMRCRYCFVHHTPARMTLDTAMKALYFLIAQQPSGENRNLNITFFGGEPTLEWDSLIVPIVKRGRELTNNKMSFNITSNGVLLNRERLEFMKENNMSLLFSFDGDEETQNYNRPMKGGQPSFPLLKDKVKLILEYFPQMTFRATVYAPTVHLMYHNFEYAVGEGYKHFFFAPDSCGSVQDWTEAVFQSYTDQLYKIANRVIEECRQGNYICISPIDRFYMTHMTGIIPYNDPNIRNIPGLGRCGVGGNGSALVAPDQKIYTCQEVFTNYEKRDAFLVGDLDNGIDKEKVKRIWDQMDFKKLRDSECYYGEHCEKCALVGQCQGGCTVRQITVCDEFNVVPYVYCRTENINYQAAKYIVDALRDDPTFQLHVNPNNRWNKG
ncbi:MAG: radical SAM protein [Clostridiales bacterium]|nr:radical SAM protein [Clostridiales bacterium]